MGGVCSVILAGGKSTRMGTNKSFLTLDNKTVIEHVADELQICSDKLVIIANEPSEYNFLQLPIFTDRYINKGPLAGIESAIYHVDADAYVFAACDMPFVSCEVYKYLLANLSSSYDAVVPIFDEQLHPLSGIYKQSVLPHIQRQIEKDELKVKGFFKHINVNYVNKFPSISNKVLQKHFFNMNNPDQYKQARTF